MKKYIKYFFVIGVLIVGFVFSCSKKDPNAPKSDTIIEGKTSILVDETLLPIIEDQLAVFENSYNAKITLIPQSEKESILSLTNSKADIVVLSRELNQQELRFFKQKKIEPRTTPFAIDAITFIKNKKSNDTLIAIRDVIDFMNGKKNSIKGLVFDNPNSSTTRYICELAGITTLPEEGVFSFKTNEDVINYIAENDGMVGIVGLNWLYQPKPEMQQNVDKVTILSVKDTNGNDYVYPSQDNVAKREYPLARVLYIVNCQGYEGLGMGFGSFITGEKGQRIILKSGLAPIREPSRNIKIRSTIETK
ncbi:MAG: substrate-binding domain-containing protein [Bacteroidota bacterium]